MTNQLMTTAFNGNSVRIFGTNDAPLFVAADVCKILDIVNTSDALGSLEDDEKTTIANPDSRPGQPGAKFFATVTESGLYALIFKSRKPDAKAFRKWVTSEVIPAIRKTGFYAVPQAPELPALPKTYAEALRALADTSDAKDKLELDVHRMEPKEQFFDAVMASMHAIDLNRAAKELGIGRNKMMAFLREKKILMNSNLPYQTYLDADYFDIHVGTYEHPTKGAQITHTTRVFQKGVDFIRRLLSAESK